MVLVPSGTGTPVALRLPASSAISASPWWIRFLVWFGRCRLRESDAYINLKLTSIVACTGTATPSFAPGLNFHC